MYLPNVSSINVSFFFFLLLNTSIW